jgi:hypothetical protein
MFKRYVNRFKQAPKTHLAAFLLLHEVTAVVPIPLFYYGLSASRVELPIPANYVKMGNQQANRVMTYFGWAKLSDEDPFFVHLAASYALVKLLMPVRLALSAALTPWLATRVLSRFSRTRSGFIKPSPSSSSP